MCRTPLAWRGTSIPATDPAVLWSVHTRSKLHRLERFLLLQKGGTELLPTAPVLHRTVTEQAAWHGHHSAQAPNNPKIVPLHGLPDANPQPGRAVISTSRPLAAQTPSSPARPWTRGALGPWPYTCRNSCRSIALPKPRQWQPNGACDAAGILAHTHMDTGRRTPQNEGQNEGLRPCAPAAWGFRAHISLLHRSRQLQGPPRTHTATWDL